MKYEDYTKQIKDSPYAKVFQGGFHSGRQYGKDMDFITQIVTVAESGLQDISNYALYVPLDYKEREPLTTFIKEYKIEVIRHTMVSHAIYFMNKDNMVSLERKE